MSRFDLHTHTAYCDGKNTPREMIEGAIARGFSKVGFSAHAYTAFDESYCMKKEDTERYLNELAALKEEYADKISVYIGFEVDAYGEKPSGAYDYLIGSAHYVLKNGRYYDVDLSLEDTKHTILTAFDGDADTYAEAYYEALGKVAAHKPTIIGHFDLLTKFNEREPIIDSTSPRYIKAWRRCADSLLALGVPFEVNTGAMSRAYRTSPYPASDILTYLASRGARFVLSGDAHSVSGLGYAFEEVEQWLSSQGIGYERAVWF